MTFNMAQINRLGQSVSSLAYSTELSVDYHGPDGALRVKAAGLCSPYTSHKTVEYYPVWFSRLPKESLLIANTRFRMLVYVGGDPPTREVMVEAVQAAAHEDVIAGLVTVMGLGRLMERIKLILPEIRAQWGATTMVALPTPRLLGYSEEGKPIFAEPETTVTEEEDIMMGFTA